MPRRKLLNLDNLRKHLKDKIFSKENADKTFYATDNKEASTLVAPVAPYLESESFVEIRVELAHSLKPLQSVTNAGIRPAVAGSDSTSQVRTLNSKHSQPLPFPFQVACSQERTWLSYKIIC